MEGTSNEAFVIARVYAESMLELAGAENAASDLLEELQGLLSVLEKDEDLQRFFVSPTLDMEARKRSIEAIFRGRASDLLVNSLQILNEKERLGIYPAVVESYREALEEQQDRVTVDVVSAVALNDAAKESISALLKQSTGKDVNLQEHVDERLIGGLVIQVGDKKLDSSIATSIRQVRDALHERTLKEVQDAASYVEA
ncbi:MAG: ATP synthase F1 subunit delta [Phycisphaerae bacterium]